MPSSGRLPSSYYAFQSRKPSVRVFSDAVVSERIEAIPAFSKGTYGAPRIHNHLRDEGIRVGRKRVARLLRSAGLVGVSRRKGFFTKKQDKTASYAPDLVNRAFVKFRM